MSLTPSDKVWRSVCMGRHALLAFVVITWSLSRYLGVVNAGNVGGYVSDRKRIWNDYYIEYPGMTR